MTSAYRLCAIITAFLFASATSADSLGPLGQQLQRDFAGFTCHEQTKEVDRFWADGGLSFTPQTINGKSILLVSGGFRAGDATRLATFLAQGPRIDEVWMNSPGGNAAEGPKVGRVIRQYRLPTRVADGFWCISSCSFAFLGGILRYVEPQGSYGVHTFYNGGSYQTVQTIESAKETETTKTRKLREYLHESEQGNAILAGQIQQYAQEMGVSRDFMTDVVFAQRSLVFMSDVQIKSIITFYDQNRNPKETADFLIDLVKNKGLRLDQNQVRQLFDIMTAHASKRDLADFLSVLVQEFKCPSAEELYRYNVTNVALRQ